MYSDEKLIKQILSGDKGAFEELIAKHYGTVYSICFNFMSNAEDARDMSQEVFIRIYNNLEKFRYESSLVTWIYRISANTCLTELKKMSRLKICTVDDSPTLEGVGANPEEAVQLKELTKLVEEELDKMGTQTGKIMRMRLYGREKFKDIAEKLGLSLSTATSIFTRSKRNLQKVIEGFYKEVD